MLAEYKNFNAHVVTVYRPPRSIRNKLTAAMFFDEFPRLLESRTVHPKPLMICGDFNFHFDDTNSSDSCNFIDLLESVNMIQHVSTPTHRKGHILDLIITRNDETFIQDVRVLDDVYSDHSVVVCKLNCPKPPPSKVLVNYRANSDLHSDKCSSDLLNSVQQLANTKDLIVSFENCNTALNNVYSTHYPLQTRWVNHSPRAAWFNQDLRVAKSEKRPSPGENV